MKQRATSNGICSGCGWPYQSGSWVVKVGLGTFMHLSCYEEET